MDETTWGGLSAWETWAQEVGKTVITAAANAEFVQPFELSKLKIQALGDAGYYTEGQRGVAGNSGAALPSGVVLLGLAALAFVLLKG